MNSGVFAFQALPETQSTGTVQQAPGAPADPGASPPSGFGLITQQKKTEATLASLKKGDRVVTQSGLIGRLVAIEGRYAKLELLPSATKVTILKSGLLGRDAEGEAAPSDTGTDKKPSKPATD